MGTLAHVFHTGARPICVTEFANALRAITPPRFPTVRKNAAREVGMSPQMEHSHTSAIWDPNHNEQGLL